MPIHNGMVEKEVILSQATLTIFRRVYLVVSLNSLRPENLKYLFQVLLHLKKKNILEKAREDTLLVTTIPPHQSVSY